MTYSEIDAINTAKDLRNMMYTKESVWRGTFDSKGFTEVIILHPNATALLAGALALEKLVELGYME